MDTLFLKRRSVCRCIFFVCDNIKEKIINLSSSPRNKIDHLPNSKKLWVQYTKIRECKHSRNSSLTNSTSKTSTIAPTPQDQNSSSIHQQQLIFNYWRWWSTPFLKSYFSLLWNYWYFDGVCLSSNMSGDSSSCCLVPGTLLLLVVTVVLDIISHLLSGKGHTLLASSSQTFIGWFTRWQIALQTLICKQKYQTILTTKHF